MRLCACFVTHSLLEHASTALLSWSQRTTRIVSYRVQRTVHNMRAFLHKQTGLKWDCSSSCDHGSSLSRKERGGRAWDKTGQSSSAHRLGGWRRARGEGAGLTDGRGAKRTGAAGPETRRWPSASACVTGAASTSGWPLSRKRVGVKSGWHKVHDSWTRCGLN